MREWPTCRDCRQLGFLQLESDQLTDAGMATLRECFPACYLQTSRGMG